MRSKKSVKIPEEAQTLVLLKSPILNMIKEPKEAMSRAIPRVLEYLTNQRI